MPGLSLVQAAEAVRSPVDPSENTPVAASWTDAPAFTLVEPEMAMLTTIAGPTDAVAEPATPVVGSVAVTVAVPTAVPVARPLAPGAFEMETAPPDVDHVTVPVRSCVLPSL
jgi:hypothetical protein